MVCKFLLNITWNQDSSHSIMTSLQLGWP